MVVVNGRLIKLLHLIVLWKPRYSCTILKIILNVIALYRPKLVRWYFDRRPLDQTTLTGCGMLLKSVAVLSHLDSRPRGYGRSGSHADVSSQVTPPHTHTHTHATPPSVEWSGVIHQARQTPDIVDSSHSHSTNR